jgi:hypothetical protein
VEAIAMDTKNVSDSNQSEDGDVPDGDILVGAAAIEAFLARLGMEDADAYYLRRTNWPIGSTSGKPIAKEPAANAPGAKCRGGGHGGKLVASKKRLANYIQRLAGGSSAA